MQAVQTAPSLRTNLMMGTVFPKGQNSIANPSLPADHPQIKSLLSRISFFEQYTLFLLILGEKIIPYLQMKLLRMVYLLPEDPREIRYDSFGNFVLLQKKLIQNPNIVCEYGIYKLHGIYTLQITLPSFEFNSLIPGIDYSYLLNKGLLYSIDVTEFTSPCHFDKFFLPNRFKFILSLYMKYNFFLK